MGLLLHSEHHCQNGCENSNAYYTTQYAKTVKRPFRVHFATAALNEHISWNTTHVFDERFDPDFEWPAALKAAMR